MLSRYSESMVLHYITIYQSGIYKMQYYINTSLPYSMRTWWLHCPLVDTPYPDNKSVKYKSMACSYSIKIRM